MPGSRGIVRLCETTQFEFRILPDRLQLARGVRMPHANLTNLNGFGFRLPQGDGGNMEAECVFYSQPSDLKVAEKYSLKGQKAEKMRMALFRLAVPQGDSGAATDYISCSHRKKDRDRPYFCFVSQAVECENILSCGF